MVKVKGKAPSPKTRRLKRYLSELNEAVKRHPELKDVKIRIQICDRPALESDGVCGPEK